MEERCEAYLGSATSLARRMWEDVLLARADHSHLWPSLPLNQRSNIIDSALIDQAIALKYEASGCVGWKLEPVSKFSWFTKSQLDLCPSPTVAVVNERSPVKKQAPQPPQTSSESVTGRKPSVTAPPSRQEVRSPQGASVLGRLRRGVRAGNGSGEERQALVELDKTIVVVRPSVVAKPKTPPPPPPTALPKTGFDFLDNW